MRITLLLLISCFTFCQAQECISGDCVNGIGIKKFSGNPPGYYEGTFKNGKFNGPGRMTYPNDGVIITGQWYDNYMFDLGSRYAYGNLKLSYFSNSHLDETRGIPYEMLKKHQDFFFQYLKPCKSLTKTTFAMPWRGNINTTYDVYNGSEKVDEETHSEIGYVGDKEFSGYVNNTNRDIYIRCYRKKYFKERGTYECIDDSFIVHPGEHAMANFRRLPEDDDLYWNYEADHENFVYVGQYYLEPGKKLCPLEAWESHMGFSRTQPAQKATVSQPVAMTTKVAKSTANSQQAAPARVLTREEKDQIADTEKRLDEIDRITNAGDNIIYFDPRDKTGFVQQSSAANLRKLRGIAQFLNVHRPKIG